MMADDETGKTVGWTCTAAVRKPVPVDVFAARLAPHIEAREKAKHDSPLAGPWETNASAREWSLLAPDGTAHRFRDLALWLRERADLFDPADVAERPQSRTGVSTNAQAQLGKLRPERRAGRKSWKGWTWLTRQ
ncbi:hypothetical protein [Methylobacterium sp. Leaf399]|uniref:hypothetical protein n=1 Tax=Methylobacterium sp. Leaf399 TaxID=1736364 RepID=UPI0006FCB201|nr:hypothetical protein [Methylobacterium sp. Leaf399]